MKSGTSLLTTAAGQGAASAIAAFGNLVSAHLSGDFKQHTQFKVQAVPYSITYTGYSSTINVDYYRKYKEHSTEKYIEFLGDPTSITYLGSTGIHFGSEASSWKSPYGSTNFAADVTATLYASNSGNYTFKLTSDDGSYAFIDGTCIIANGGNHVGTTVTKSVSLSQGPHDLEIQYYANATIPSYLSFPLPSGLVYSELYTRKNTLGDRTLNLKLDVADPVTGAITSKVVAVPISIGTSTFTPTHLPIIVTQPLSQSAAQDSSITLSVVAISDLALTYQWFFNGIKLTDAILSTYTVPKVSADTAGEYYVIVSNASGQTVSNTATISFTV
jgi:hypothetical protein